MGQKINWMSDWLNAFTEIDDNRAHGMFRKYILSFIFDFIKMTCLNLNGN